MILLLSLLLLLARSDDDDLPPIDAPVPLTVQCVDQTDELELLFSICVTDPVCAYVYSLDHHRRHARDLFYHQMRLFDIFGPPPPPGTWLEGRWPANVTITFDSGGASCYNLSALSTTERALFNYVVLDRLKTHKQYYSRLVCAHHNERLLYDLETASFNCVCLEGKQCSDESWHDTVVLVLGGLILGLFVLMFLVVLVLGLRLLLRKAPAEGDANKQD
jgi:hypothetical protein